MDSEERPSTSIHSSREYFESVDWKSISLTHVEYPKGDLVGFLLAWSSLVPMAVIVGFITLIIFRRDLHTISYFAGLLLNECVNFSLKHTIKEYRPHIARTTLVSQYGMPSSHAQFMFYFSTYSVFFLLIRVHHNFNTVDNLWKYLTCLGSYSLAVVVAYSRVYLGYHSLSQVCWGAVAGICCGILWFAVVHLIFTPFFPAIAGWPVSEWLMLRDSTLIPNVLWFEYTSHRQEARSRQRKITARKSL